MELASIAVLADIPLWWWIGNAFVFGVVIGSFLNVYLYRFHTGKSLMGGSHCMSCAGLLRWYDLFPLLSYLTLRGRCRQCRAYIPARYFWVELLTGTLFGVVVYIVSDVLLWPVLFFLMAVLVLVLVYDIMHMIIPHEFVYALSVVTALLLGYNVWRDMLDPLGVLLHLCAGVLAGAFFYGLWWYSEGRWVGLGDAKLALPLGTMVGLGGVFSMIVLSFWIGTIIALTLLGYERYKKRGQLRLPFTTNRLTMKSEVPFAPFLILGFLAVFLGQIDVLTFFTW
jgi:prepilin signal peptidase PulO-like enzyme (type II secretory pathway)